MHGENPIQSQSPIGGISVVACPLPDVRGSVVPSSVMLEAAKHLNGKIKAGLQYREILHPHTRTQNDNKPQTLVHSAWSARRQTQNDTAGGTQAEMNQHTKLDVGELRTLVRSNFSGLPSSAAWKAERNISRYTARQDRRFRHGPGRDAENQGSLTV